MSLTKQEQTPFEADPAFGSGAISKFPEGSPLALRYRKETVQHVDEIMEVSLTEYPVALGDLTANIGGAYVTGRRPVVTALRWIRLMSGEELRTLDVTKFSDRRAHTFLAPGTPPDEWHEALWTGETVHDALKNNPDSTINAAGQSWPDSPTESFEPLDGLTLVRLR